MEKEKGTKCEDFHLVFCLLRHGTHLRKNKTMSANQITTGHATLTECNIHTVSWILILGPELFQLIVWSGTILTPIEVVKHY